MIRCCTTVDERHPTLYMKKGGCGFKCVLNVYSFRWCYWTQHADLFRWAWAALNVPLASFGILKRKLPTTVYIYIVSDMMLFYVIGCSVTYRSILENNIGMIPLFMPTMQQNSTPLVAMLLWRVGGFTTWGINHFKNGLSVSQKQGEKQPAPLYMTYNHHHALMLGPQEDLMKLLDNQQVWSSNGAKENGTMYWRHTIISSWMSQEVSKRLVSRL